MLRVGNEDGEWGRERGWERGWGIEQEWERGMERNGNWMASGMKGEEEEDRSNPRLHYEGQTLTWQPSTSHQKLIEFRKTIMNQTPQYSRLFTDN